MNINFDNGEIKSENRITVITGNNGSGKTRLINTIKKNTGNNAYYIVLDSDSHSHLSKTELEKFVSDIKEQSKTKQIIIASLRNELIEIADKVITLKDEKGKD